MNIDIKDLITLDDNNEYAVCSKAMYQGIEYLYLIDINENQNFKFAHIEARENELELKETFDKKLIQALLPLFAEKGKDILAEILSHRRLVWELPARESNNIAATL